MGAADGRSSGWARASTSRPDALNPIQTSMAGNMSGKSVSAGQYLRIDPRR
jgi:hypothetical protein